MELNNLIEAMMELGLNKYESKAYINLLKNPNITAYELGNLSGIPQAKIYETMNKLLEKNLVNIISNNPKKYICVEYEDFLERKENDYKNNIKYLKNNLSKVKEKKEVSHITHLQKEKQIEEKIIKMLDSANEFIYLETWKEDYIKIQKQLKEIEKKGIKIVIMIYGKGIDEIGRVYYHEMDGMEENKKSKGRWFTLIIDRKESMFCVFKDINSQAFWTKNQAFMLMAESFIAHDIYLAEIYKDYKKELDLKFGPNLKSIREDISIGYS
ncbi:MAG: TrmB family transcriptional regulator [Peptostreptococcaceae bacterium]|nr:TrmB family transcriptional regulator [Peptostreptococcaceae bacterium]